MTGETIKLLRLYHGLTTEKLAKEVGVASSTLRNIETGRYPVSSTVQTKLAKRFDSTEKGFIEFVRRFDGFDSVEKEVGKEVRIEKPTEY